jgi:hypothetical protein
MLGMLRIARSPYSLGIFVGAAVTTAAAILASLVTIARGRLTPHVIVDTATYTFAIHPSIAQVLLNICT